MIVIRRTFFNVRIARIPGGFAVIKGPRLLGTRATFNEAYFFARAEANNG